MVPELVGCEKYISECKVCVFDNRTAPICTLCNDGYFEHLESRSCIPCSDQNATKCSHKESDAKKLAILGFYGAFVERDFEGIVIVDNYYS